MPSPFPGMDPFLETNPIFQELHTQMLADIQARLQPQLRPNYVARLERHLSAEELDADELELRKQRRIVIYVQDQPRLAVTGIELLSPGNKQAGAVAQERYQEKRASALHGGLHWVELDLLRGGVRPRIPVPLPESADYLSYVAQANADGLEPPGLCLGARRSAPRAADSAARPGSGAARSGQLFCRGLRPDRCGRRSGLWRSPSPSTPPQERCHLDRPVAAPARPAQAKPRGGQRK